MTEQKYCGTCRWKRRENGEWVCTNDESDAYGLDVAYDDECEEWEGKG